MRKLLVVLIAAAAVLALSIPVVTAQTGIGTFTPGPCPVDAVPDGVVDGVDVQCGTVDVPMRHTEPTGPTLTIPVAIFPALGPNPAPDPLFMLQGGPGGSAIDFFIQGVTEYMDGSDLLREDRDIVLVDQRGTLYTEPNLMCSEIEDLTYETVSLDIEDDDYMVLYLAALGACRDRLTTSGLDLSAFNSVESARDINLIREALGYDQINLYGVSYGTKLAQHYMRLFPQTLRSVMLDAVVPLLDSYTALAPQSGQRAFDQLFTACANDSSCAARYPDLEQRFYDLVDVFEAAPISITVTNDMEDFSFAAGTTFDTILYGEDLAVIIFQLLYDTSALPLLPAIINLTESGNYQIVEIVASALIFDFSISYGLYYSVSCSEDAAFVAEEVKLEGVREVLANVLDETELLDVCVEWGVDALDPNEVSVPVISDIPTLLTSGQFDPITPPEYATEVGRGLSRAFSFVFPVGHGALLGGICPVEVYDQFLTDPTTMPDASCIADMSLSFQ